jgi:ABC-2 type transport system ATP-binding protein
MIHEERFPVIQAFPMNRTILQVRDLHKRYGATVALDHVSLEVREGEMFGLLGPNGAGKTTLLSILSCLLEPNSGEVTLFDEKLHRGNFALRSLIGIVPQELAVYGELTARENLTFFGELYGMRGDALRHRVDEVLASVALADRADQRVSTFSGGMKRRLNLGAALVHGPRLLLLDEPTTGVDPQSRNHIFEEVRTLNSKGLTVVYTSHYMEEVEALCTRIGIIDHGKLIACDSLAGLLRQMPGLIRFRVPHISEGIRHRLAQVPGVVLHSSDDREMEMECRDVKTSLLQLVAVLNDSQTELTSLETREPNLERVFLHLTGRGLRD